MTEFVDFQSLVQDVKSRLNGYDYGRVVYGPLQIGTILYLRLKLEWMRFFLEQQRASTVCKEKKKTFFLGFCCFWCLRFFYFILSVQLLSDSRPY